MDVKWEGIEDTFASFCKAYGVACLSLRDAIFRDVLASKPNFTVPDVAADCLHPEQSNFGYHYFADTIIHFLRKSWARRYRPAPPADAPYAPTPLPPPLLAANRGAPAGSCGAATRSTRPRHRNPSPPRPKKRSACPPAATARSTPRARACRAYAGKRSCRAALRPSPTRRAAPSCDAACSASRGAARTARVSAAATGGCTHALALRAPRKPGVVSVLPGAVMRLVVDTAAPVDANLTTAKLALTLPRLVRGHGRLHRLVRRRLRVRAAGDRCAAGGGAGAAGRWEGRAQRLGRERRRGRRLRSGGVRRPPREHAARRERDSRHFCRQSGSCCRLRVGWALAA